MKSLDLADVSRLPEELKDGETIELRDGGRVVAEVVPHEERAQRGTVPDWFLSERPPKFPTSLLEQLLHDRRSRDW
jgi:antitoxin (DNA-binding transcriptional repressor) of toxin-antitoxin stability system